MAKKPLGFKPLLKSRLYEEVAEQIKQAIYEGKLEPGDRLPSERNLCQMFGVGRPTIREALRTLSVMGLVEIGRGSKGARVSEADISRYVQTMQEQLSWMIKADQNTLEELWEVRRYIELGIAKAAAKNAKPKDIKKLTGMIKKMEACGDDIESYFPLAVEFHQELALLTDNKVFFLFWEMCQSILLKGYIPILRDVFPDGPVRLLEGNKMMLEAIISKDSEAIDKAMTFHSSLETFFEFQPVANPALHKRETRS